MGPSEIHEGVGFSIQKVAIDCNDLDGMTTFWARMTGYEVVEGDEAYRLLAHRDGRKPELFLQKVPEPRTEKNRLHIDLIAGADVEAAAAVAESLGATRIQRHDDPAISWIVMADPEGNQFCLDESDG
jgi:catechol 2,3-dioxygenase-like lactoylglutathione lyase family enzyme